MQKWEYKQISREMDFTGTDYMNLGPGSGPVYIWRDIDKEDTERFLPEMRRLRKLGEAGWELVSVLYSEVGEKHIYTYYLKRHID